MNSPLNTAQPPSVIVVIPAYRASLTPHERISLQQCVTMLGHYPLTVVKPEGLDLSGWLADFPTLQFDSFADAYFTSIAGYNELLCSELFYERFLAYDYMLICQLDAFILRDTLADWCRRGYDYIGAPQFADVRPVRDEPETLRTRVSKVFQRPLFNGGLSLRRVRACLRLLRSYHRFHGRWPGNEDGFFSLHYPRLIPYRHLIRSPKPDEALHFAIELEPARSLALNDGQLPMGCHAWDKYDLDFWRPILRQFGHEV
ncbi:DUF5672 family protein [Fibrella aestuarina]|uniref:DUF5672 family protein n=1 Tax=Fibrella aestuarina TaxID=651143 RepID=UPI0006885F32|nr:DUF5672 family protein [Fibrella aestuarina]